MRPVGQGGVMFEVHQPLQHDSGSAAISERFDTREEAQAWIEANPDTHVYLPFVHDTAEDQKPKWTVPRRRRQSESEEYALMADRAAADRASTWAETDQPFQEWSAFYQPTRPTEARAAFDAAWMKKPEGYAASDMATAAANGFRAAIQPDTRLLCQECKGSGFESGQRMSYGPPENDSEPIECGECDGRGQIFESIPDYLIAKFRRDQIKSQIPEEDLCPADMTGAIEWLIENCREWS